MYITNIKKFLRMGINTIPTQGNCMKEMIGPSLFAGLGVYTCSLLKGYYFLIALGLVCIVVLNAIITYKISSCTMTLRRCLMLKSVAFVTWVFVLSLLELIIFLMWKGFHISLFLLYLPIVIIPLLVMLLNYKVMMRDTEYAPKVAVSSNIGKIGFVTGLWGMNFAAIFRNVEQSTAYIIVLCCLSIINCFTCLGLGYIQKVYWAEKYRITFEDDKPC